MHLYVYMCLCVCTLHKYTYMSYILVAKILSLAPLCAADFALGSTGIIYRLYIQHVRACTDMYTTIYLHLHLQLYLYLCI